MANGASDRIRFFKTKWFSREARKALISDRELCSAIRQVMLGQAVDLGGGVFKKRLGKNLYRSILVAKGRRYWVYVYLFAKKDQANIRPDELRAYRKAAAIYLGLSEDEIAAIVKQKLLSEIAPAKKGP